MPAVPDNVVADPGTGGAAFRTYSDSAEQHPASVLEFVSGGAPGAWDLQPVTPVNGLPVVPSPATSGGLSVFRLLSAATTNAASVKASPGQIYTIAAFNLVPQVVFLKIYDTATLPVAGSGTPVMTLPIPAGDCLKGGGFTLTLPVGIKFSSGIGITVTGAAGDTDVTPLAVNQAIVNIFYA